MAREDAERAETENGGDFAVANAGVERDLKRRLDEREERRSARVVVADGHDVSGRNDEAGLVRMEGEDTLALADLAS